MLLRDVTVVNGMVRTKDSVRDTDYSQYSDEALQQLLDTMPPGAPKYVIDEIKKEIERRDKKTKDAWSPEARAKALEARRAHKKAQPDQLPQRRQPTKLNSQEKEWYRAAKQNLEEAKRNGDAEKAKKLETEIKQFEKEYL